MGFRVPWMAALGIFALGAGCSGDDEFSISAERERACLVRDEAAFATASAKLQAAYHNTTFSKGSLFISRCGYMMVTTRSGVKKRAPFTGLYAEVGSPTWEVSVSARQLTYDSGRTYQNESMFEYTGRTGRGVTRPELVEMNRTLNQLARSATGGSSSAVDIDADLEGAASLRRAGARIRGAAGAALAAVANAPTAPAGSSGSSGTKAFRCTQVCSANGLAATTGIVGDSRREITETIRAGSRSEAASYANSTAGNICKPVGLSRVAGFNASCR